MTAIISQCGIYRYLLTRPGDLCGDRPPALFVMLNPSTADATVDDPTIRRCRAFGAAWGCRGIEVVNLYALRATNPDDLWTVDDPIGPDNDRMLATKASEHREVICAWGRNAQADRVDAVVAILRAAGAQLLCFGTNQDGSPVHPLYQPASQKLIPWEPRSCPV